MPTTMLFIVISLFFGLIAPLFAQPSMQIAAQHSAQHMAPPSTQLHTPEIATPHANLTGKFIPEDNQTLLFIGQDSDTISRYISEVPEDNIEGFTLYTSLKSNDIHRALPGMTQNANWNAGNTDFTKTLNQLPNAALAIGLAFDGCRIDPTGSSTSSHQAQIAQGNYDNAIIHLATQLKTLAPRKVFLRIGYEFDGPWNCYSPAHYKSAFRRIALTLKAQNVTNVVTVWQSATWPDPSIAGERATRYDHRQPNHLLSWYPGDDVVDWIGLSVFYRNLSQWNYQPTYTPQLAQDKLLNFARQKAKPVMIAEAAPQGYHIGKLTQSPIQTNLASPVSAEEIWSNWYQLLFNYVDQNRDIIKALAYINTHWESQGMWYCAPGKQAGNPGCANGNWGDSRVQANPLIKQRWLQEITNADRWVQAQ